MYGVGVGSSPAGVAAGKAINSGCSDKIVTGYIYLTVDEQRRRVAYHEAGHAVVAHVLGLEIDSIDMFYEPNRCGCWVRWGQVRKRNIMCLVAGDIAEAKERSDGREWVTQHENSTSDMLKANRLVSESGLEGDVAMRFWVTTWWQTQQLLTENWSLVQLLARELLTRTYLSNTEIGSLLAPTTERSLVALTA